MLWKGIFLDVYPETRNALKKKIKRFGIFFLVNSSRDCLLTKITVLGI